MVPAAAKMQRSPRARDPCDEAPETSDDVAAGLRREDPRRVLSGPCAVNRARWSQSAMGIRKRPGVRGAGRFASLRDGMPADNGRPRPVVGALSAGYDREHAKTKSQRDEETRGATLSAVAGVATELYRANTSTPGEADLPQIAELAEVYNGASHHRSAEEVAAMALQAGGLATLRAEGVQLAQSVAEAMPSRRGRRRRA